MVNGDQAHMPWVISKIDEAIYRVNPARVTASFVDSYVFVVEWAKTNIDVIVHNLRGAPVIQEKLLGVVLNKADLNVLARYESHHGRYDQKYYARYGYTE